MSVRTPIATPSAEPRRHRRRTVYRAVAFELDAPPPAPEPANFLAFNDCIHISCQLLALPREPEELLYPAEHIHAMLTQTTAPPWLENASG